ncbi:glyoxalase/bleomycin resistance protein/dioxygenase superfamily protein [Aminivibrio pyruvatiphilus]|uniref:Glyoxalase/bleomycin resistance protein/dioxygenase superfamily protein n=1 Tax=Aminivibrio pyruvatiphilus TaxID=1005740 RepID=A0A4R8M1T6_9BACT|nr:VOC family protein [Aminivibrio pyruvatiphilus]TDY56659.1 glyoxalase/bleomycin resistance protein/dioxygenase superfamily protein [Aminivibrio pyruvatiphilus]
MPEICSQITFFYYKDLAKAADFYERIMGFELADDQGTCRIYRVRESAFLGIVDERYGHCSAPKSESTVLATFVVDDVREWYEHLRKNGVTIISELLSRPEIQIEAFFFEDPEGYALEAQSFLNPVLRPVFGQREIL